jgi:hypothetical protein
MVPERNRLLLLLVLLLGFATAGWTTARAGGKTGSTPVLSASVTVAKPPAAPTSGEPDVGQTPRPTVTKGWMSPAPRGEGGHSQGHATDLWFGWIFRMRAIWYLGAR